MIRRMPGKVEYFTQFIDFYKNILSNLNSFCNRSLFKTSVKLVYNRILYLKIRFILRFAYINTHIELKF